MQLSPLLKNNKSFFNVLIISWSVIFFPSARYFCSSRQCVSVAFNCQSILMIRPVNRVAWCVFIVCWSFALIFGWFYWAYFLFDCFLFVFVNVELLLINVTDTKWVLVRNSNFYVTSLLTHWRSANILQAYELFII